LGNSERGARDEARAALRQLGAAALPELTRMSADLKSDRKQRSNAIDAIGYAGTKDGPEVQILVAALKDKQSVVRASALTAMGNLNVDPTILVPLCIEMLDDSNNGVRRRASVDLGGMAEAAIAAVPALRKATKDENDSARAAAVEALKKIVPPPTRHVVRVNHSPFHLDGNNDPPRENGIGMKFKHIASLTNGTATGTLFVSVWKTRIGDFDKFVTATGYDATEGVYTYGTNSWQNRGNTWKNPGWEVTPDHPVCGVNWIDAVKFCEWLTESERAASKIGPHDEYRLPSDDEWSLMVGEATFPWGETWPPPPGAGNYMDDSETKVFPRDHGIKGYHDGFPITSPVGSFKANPLGLYDVGGNLWEWCSDLYQKLENATPDQSSPTKPETKTDPGQAMFRVLRGAAWHTSSKSEMASDHRRGFHPAIRNDLYGFRCVLVVE
jgi:formylglycine-generating enzyme required for sulfatase activity